MLDKGGKIGFVFVDESAHFDAPDRELLADALADTSMNVTTIDFAPKPFKAPVPPYSDDQVRYALYCLRVIGGAEAWDVRRRYNRGQITKTAMVERTVEFIRHIKENPTPCPFHSRLKQGRPNV